VTIDDSVLVNGVGAPTKVELRTNATPPECRNVDNGHHTRLRCGAYWEGGGLLLGAEALGAGLVAGSIGVGAAAAVGVFDDDDHNKQQSPSK